MDAGNSSGTDLDRPRSGRLPEDLMLLIDQMFSDFLIDEQTYLTLTLFVPSGPIDAVLNSGDETTSIDDLERAKTWTMAGRTDDGLSLYFQITPSRRMRYADALIDMARVYRLANLSEKMRGHLVHRGLEWARSDIEGIANFYASATYEDETTGGSMKAFRKIVRLKRDGTPTPRVARRIHSERHIKRVTRDMPETRDRLKMYAVLVGDAKAVGPELIAPGIDNIIEAINIERLENRYLREAEFRQHLEKQSDAAKRQLGYRVRKKLRAKERSLRRVMTRSLASAENVLGQTAVRDLMIGKEIRLEGDAVAFQIRLARGVSHMGHGALDIYLHDISRAGPDGGIMPGPRLAHLCLYIKETPALDQCVALWLAVASGDELDLVWDGNLSMITQAGKDHPVICRRQEKRLARIIVQIDQDEYACIDGAGGGAGGGAGDGAGVAGDGMANPEFFEAWCVTGLNDGPPDQSIDDGPDIDLYTTQTAKPDAKLEKITRPARRGRGRNKEERRAARGEGGFSGRRASTRQDGKPYFDRYWSVTRQLWCDRLTLELMGRQTHWLDLARRASLAALEQAGTTAPHGVLDPYRLDNVLALAGRRVAMQGEVLEKFEQMVVLESDRLCRTSQDNLCPA